VYPGDPGKALVTHNSAVALNFIAPEARSVAAFAKHIGLSRSRLYELIADGVVVARKCGARTLIFDADNQNFRQSLPILRSAGE
jgi:hypothetical protein